MIGSRYLWSFNIVTSCRHYLAGIFLFACLGWLVVVESSRASYVQELTDTSEVVVKVDLGKSYHRLQTR